MARTEVTHETESQRESLRGGGGQNQLQKGKQVQSNWWGGIWCQDDPEYRQEC